MRLVRCSDTAHAHSAASWPTTGFARSALHAWTSASLHAFSSARAHSDRPGESFASSASTVSAKRS